MMNLVMTEEAITKMKGRFRAGYALDFQVLLRLYVMHAL